MQIKLIFGIISVIIGTVAFLPYFIDILNKKTKLHAFTWLIWAITQGTAVTAMWIGGGGLGALGLTVGTILVIFIFFFSLREKEKKITKSDIVVLAFALSGIVLWWLTQRPILSVILVSILDVSGYIPTFRKSFMNPWSETIVFWVLCFLANIFAILALQDYNLLTLIYIVAINLANMALFVFLLIRRKQLSLSKRANG